MSDTWLVPFFGLLLVGVNTLAFYCGMLFERARMQSRNGGADHD